MWFYLLVAAGVFLVVLIVANIISYRQSRAFRGLLAYVAVEVPEDYFDPFGEKAMSTIQYRENQFSGVIVANEDGVFLQSVFKFNSVIPWERIAAIRVVKLRGETIANLRIHYEGIVDRDLTVSWNPAFKRSVPEGFNYIEG